MSSSCSDVCISTYTHSPLHPCFYSNRGSCKMLYHRKLKSDASYKLPCLRCKVPCMFTNNNKDNQVREYIHVSLGFMVYN